MSDWLQGLIITFSIPNPIKFIKKRQNCFYTHWPEFYYVHVYTIIMVQLYCLYLNMYLFRRWLFLIWPPICWIIAPRVLCVLSCRPVKRRLIIHDTVRPIHSSSMRLNDSQFFASITPFSPLLIWFFFCRMAALSALIIWSKSKFWGDQCLVVCFLCLSYTLQVVFWFGSSIVLTSCTWRLCVVVETGMVWVLAREKKHSKKSRCVVHFWVLSHL